MFFEEVCSGDSKKRVVNLVGGTTLAGADPYHPSAHARPNGVSSLANRKEERKWRENTNQKAPDGFSRLEVLEKAATKTDDHNHPNSLQRVNYRNEL